MRAAAGTTRRAGRSHPLAAGGAPGTFTLPLATPLVRGLTRVIAVIPSWIWLILAILTLLTGVAAIRARLIARRAEGLERHRRQLLADIGLLQEALLPDPPATLNGIAVSAAYRPAEGPGAGGDFYDVFALEDGRVGAIIGDIAGHGRAALSATTLVRLTLRAYLEAGLGPRQALQMAGGVLPRQLPEGLLATVLVVSIEPATGLLAYASAGHPHPVIDAAGDFLPVLASSSPPLGTRWATGRRQTTLRLGGSPTLCLYTDGLPEAKLTAERLGDERLRRWVAELAPEDGADALLLRISASAQARPDDMAACLLRLPAAPEGPAERVELLELDAGDLASLRPRRFLEACGLEPGAVERALEELRELLSRGARAEVEVHLGQGPRKVLTRPVNVASLTQLRRQDPVPVPKEIAL